MVKRMTKRDRRSVATKTKKKHPGEDRAAQGTARHDAEQLEAVAVPGEGEAKKGPTPFVFWATMPLQLTSMWWDACESTRKAMARPWR